MGSGPSDHFPRLIGVQVDPGQVVSLGKQQAVTQWSQRFTQSIRIEVVGFDQDFSTITERDVCVLAKHVDILSRLFQIWHEGRLLNRDIMSEYDLDKSFHEIVETQGPGIDNAQRLQTLQRVSGVVERLLDLGHRVVQQFLQSPACFERFPEADSPGPHQGEDRAFHGFFQGFVGSLIGFVEIGPQFGYGDGCFLRTGLVQTIEVLGKNGTGIATCADQRGPGDLLERRADIVLHLGVVEDVLHGMGQVIPRVIVDDRKYIDSVEVILFFFGPDGSMQNRPVQHLTADGIGHRNLPLIQVARALVELVMKVPQIRSMIVIDTGQSRNVARLVRS